MNPFDGKVAIVTGAGRGIGRALCQALAQRGATVVATDVDAGTAVATATAIAAAGGNARSARLDVGDAAAFDAVVADTVQACGRLDFLFNNAGLGIWGDVLDLTLEQWHRVIDVDLWGVINGTLAAYRVMAARGSGHIVNVASLAGLVSAPVIVPYAAAKHAVVGLSTSLRAEAASRGVRVSVVCPGPIRTGFHAALLRPAEASREPRPPADSVDVDAAARVILTSVARNRAVIVFPSRARYLWMLQRWAPWAIARINRRTVESMRR